MREMSLHILDIIENGVNAQADLIHLSIIEDREKNRLDIVIKDNGRGISKEMLEKVMDPFFTTRTTRRVGLGLSMFRETSKKCGGDFYIQSSEGEGTEVKTTFQLDHIDLPPMGEIAGSLTTLIMGNENVDFVYTHTVDGQEFELDTRDIKRELEDVPINHPDVILHLAQSIRESLREMKSVGTA